MQMLGCIHRHSLLASLSRVLPFAAGRSPETYRMRQCLGSRLHATNCLLTDFLLAFLFYRSASAITFSIMDRSSGNSTVTVVQIISRLTLK